MEQKNELSPIGGIYTKVSSAYQRGLYEGGVRCLKASTHDDGVVMEVSEQSHTENHPGIYVQISENLTVYAVWYPKKECYVAIRKLTPKECFRLQGWTDDYFEKAQFVNSDSQLYKQAGNGVTVSVIKAIAEHFGEVDA